MSENINFIPANELPVAEGDEVSVLCLENGELKQKAANGLGGGGNPEYDLVVRVTLAFNEDELYVESHEIISGSYDAVVQKIDSYVIPRCLIIENGAYWDCDEIKAVDECIPCWSIYTGKMPSIYLEGYMGSYDLYEDGTIERE